MNIERERELFLEWHFNEWKINNSNDESIEFAKMLYERVYSHDHTSCVRDIEFKAWLTSASREGYKMVPVVDTDAMWSAGRAVIEENGYSTDASDVYKAMIGAIK